jgi:hypothetical protein
VREGRAAELDERVGVAQDDPPSPWLAAQHVGGAVAQQRLVGAGRIVDAVAGRAGLRTGLDRERGTDIVWTLNSPDVYQLLRVTRGWSPDDYENWLGRSLTDALLERP